MKFLKNILKDKNNQLPQQGVDSFGYNQQPFIPQSIMQQPLIQPKPTYDSVAYQNNLVRNLQPNKYYQPKNQRPPKQRMPKVQSGYEQSGLDSYINNQPQLPLQNKPPIMNISKSLFEEYDYVPQNSNLNGFAGFKAEPQQNSEQQQSQSQQSPQNEYEYGFNINNIQIQNQQIYHNPQDYFEPQDFNEFDGAYNKVNKSEYKNVEIPLQICREIKAEKLRLFFWLTIGTIGLIFCLMMLVGFYRNWTPHEVWLGFKHADIVCPIFTIPLTIISTGIVFVSLLDFSLIFSNVAKYQMSIYNGNETIPYFITRNYRAFIKRETYITWLSFSIYLVGSLVLMILYGMQSKYESGSQVYFFFWKIGNLKSFSTEIAVTIAILLTTLGVHVGNIIWTKYRKNNIISYYGYEILPSEEIKEIKRRTNKICLITWLVVLAILLFIVVIPWLLIRRKRGLSMSHNQR